ncbi:MAG: O-antigen ligase family protein [Ilumatobacteraceae bacterium]
MTVPAITSTGGSTARRPLGAIVSQLIVAGSSLLLSFVALRELGASGLGVFSLLLGVLITVNSVQTGWIGDSLTVLDRFDPGIRRALFQSQWAAVGLISLVTYAIALQVDGVDGTAAALFALASVAWSLEETCRRILIARREFWSLVANDTAFAVGSLGLVAAVIASGNDLTIEIMILSLLAGGIVAIGLAVVQLPRIELLRGPVEPSRMRELASFAGWRAIQVGLRPGTMAIVRAVVAATAGFAALGELEAARLLIAPVLTIVNGAGVYLLPTYANQVRRLAPFRPTIRRAMLVVAALAGAYGVLAMLLRDLLVDLLTNGDTVVSAGAVVSWITFSVAFGVGVPAGSAMVALGHSRRTFAIRAVDAAIGVTAASLLAVAGFVAAVPAGLAAGAFVGAALLVRALHREPARVAPDDPADTLSETPADTVAGIVPPPPIAPAHWRWSADDPPSPPPAPVPAASSPPPPPRRSARPRPARPAMRVRTPASRSRRRNGVDWHRELLWVVPLLMIVATEWKIRRRNIDDLLSGSIDPMIAIELLVYAVAGLWAIWRLVPSKPRLQPLMMIMWGYVLTTAVSALYSSFPMLALARAVQLVIIATVVQLIASQGTLVTITRFLHGWIVLLTVSIAAGLAYVAPTTGPQEGRFTWLSVHSVSAGSMLALSVPLLLGLWLSAARRPLPWPRWAYGSLFLIHLVFLLLTRTRGSIGGALVAIAVMAWLSSGRRMKPELVLGSLVIGGALALAFGRPVLEFLTRGETVDQIGTFNRRTEIWSLAWESFLERPLFGLGFNSAKGVFFDETGLGGAHNAAINVMIDVGLAGLIWWVALIVGCLVVLGRLRGGERRSPMLLLGATGTARSDHLVLIGLFTAMLVNSITTEGLGAGVNVSAIWLFIAAAWLTVLDRDQRNARSARERELTVDPVASLAGR